MTTPTNGQAGHTVCPKCGKHIETIRTKMGGQRTVLAGVYETVWEDGRAYHGQVDHPRNCNALREIRRREGLAW
jgi:hypothetical protein